MSSVTFSPSVGGDGSTVTDDSNATTGLDGGGHRTRFVPALAQVVAVAAHTVTKAGEAAASAGAAASSASSAADQVGLTTAAGAAQVALAAAHVATASSQATASATSASQAAASASQATASASQAAASAAQAAASAAQAAAHSHVIADVTGLQAQLDGIATGATAYTHPANHPPSIITQDASNRFVADTEKATWNAKQAALVSGTNIKTIGGVSLLGPGDIPIASASLANFAYANRANLRALSPSAGDAAVVGGLGLFVWEPSSVEIDDDETCFATTLGCWLLQAAHPEHVFASWTADVSRLETQSASLESRSASLESRSASLESRSALLEAATAKTLHGKFAMPVTSVGATSSIDIIATVTGAAVGDSVFATPGDVFGNSATDRARLSLSAHVSATNTVTVSIRNPSAAAASMTASTWRVTVIKP